MKTGFFAISFIRCDKICEETGEGEKILRKCQKRGTGW